MLHYTNPYKRVKSFSEVPENCLKEYQVEYEKGIDPENCKILRKSLLYLMMRFLM